ncbi:MAG: DNA-3-methyladenine glycosylase family protein [Gemmatimonadaceae bacterium]
MKKPRPYTPGLHRAAVRHLKRSDPVLAGVVARCGPQRFALRTDGTHFDAIARAIVSQQLSVKAASTIHGRFFELYESAGGRPEFVARIPETRLREAGLSWQKISYIKDLARLVASGELALTQIDEMSDDELIARLISVKGVGIWTAQMFLMFRLGRPDVLPTLDLGIQKAIQRAYGLRKVPSAQRMEKIGRSWAPYRTVACWYLWRSLDQPAVVAPARKRSKSKRPAAS